MKIHSLTLTYNIITKREREILHLKVFEYSTQEIADKFCISFKTVKSHCHSLMIKLYVKNVAGIVREANSRDIVDIRQNIIQMNHRTAI